MIKTLGLSALCAGMLYAATVDDVKTLYDKQDYSGVKSMSAELLKAKPYDTDLNLLAGKAALALDELKSAVLYAKKVIEVDRNNPDAYQLIGDALLADGKPDRAERFHKIAKNLREKGPKAHLFNVLLSVGGGYDSNVNSHPGSGRMNEYYVLETIVPSVVTKRESAGYIQEMLFANHIYDADSKSPFSYKSQVMLFNKNVIGNSEYNSLVANLKTGPQWNMGSYKFWLPLKVGKMRYGNDPYTETVAVEPTVNMKLQKNYRLSINAKAERTEFENSAQRIYDFERYGALIGVERAWNAQSLYFGYRYFNASARNDTATLTYADNDDHGITLKYTQKISAELKANMQLHYDRKSFDDVTYTSSTEKREDDLVVLKGEANYKLNDVSFVNMALKYVNNDTNYLPLDYERTDVLMTYNILF